MGDLHGDAELTGDEIQTSSLLPHPHPKPHESARKMSHTLLLMLDTKEVRDATRGCPKTEEPEAI